MQASDKDDLFYIGYQPKMPAPLARKIKLLVAGLAALVVVVAITLVVVQRGFSTGTFELTQETVVEGMLVKAPVPMLRVQVGNDWLGKPAYRNLLLINFGKFGADGLLESYEQKLGGSVADFEVSMKGKLIYRDGVGLMELSSQDAALQDFKRIDNQDTQESDVLKTLGAVSLEGEIVDPKCYFGVMKPGSGKPHRSCAVRCISGGIPPVLRVADQAGAVQYYVLMGAQGEAINQEVLSYVGESITVEGKHHQQGEWNFVYLNPKIGIRTLL